MKQRIENLNDEIEKGENHFFVKKQIWVTENTETLTVYQLGEDDQSFSKQRKC
jgi:hypothetical protein